MTTMTSARAVSKIQAESSTEALSACSSWTCVPVDFIERTLDLYQKESVTISGVLWNAGHLKAQVAHMEYPFTKPGHIDYMTAAMALLYVSQVSYLNVRMLITTRSLPHGVPVTDEDFFIARDAGDLVFSHLHIRFREKLRASRGTFELEQVMSRIRVSRSAIWAKFSCCLGGRSCLASGIFAMPHPGESHLKEESHASWG